MVRIHFQGMLGSTTCIGPCPRIRFSGGAIHTSNSEQAIGRLVDHQWRVHDAFFAHFETPDPVLVHFEDAAGAPTEPLGPFRRFHGSSGVMYAEDTLFAHLTHDLAAWCEYRSAQCWPHMVLSAAGLRPAA